MLSLIVKEQWWPRLQSMALRITNKVTISDNSGSSIIDYGSLKIASTYGIIIIHNPLRHKTFHLTLVFTPG